MAQETGIILIGLKYVEKLAGNPITLFFLLWLGGFTICSYIFTGDFFAWWRPLNFTLFVTFAGLALIASGSWYLITRYRITKMSNIRGPLIVGIPDLSQGWLNIGSLDYNGVKWNVRVPRLPFYQRRYRLEDVPSVIDIEDPRCPHCNTILNEAKTFWGNYIWTCPRCGFKKKHKLDQYDERKNAKKVAVSEVEERFNEFSDQMNQ